MEAAYIGKGEHDGNAGNRGDCRAAFDKVAQGNPDRDLFSGASSTRSCGRYSPSYVSSYLRVKRSPEMVGGEEGYDCKDQAGH